MEPKQNSFIDDDKVKLARHRFKNVLKSLVQDICMDEEGSDSYDEENRMYGYRSKRTVQGFSGVNFRFPKRKKKNQVDIKPPDQSEFQPAFITKLFEREVNVAQFDVGTALYPVCRAWIHNKPKSRRVVRDEESELSDMEYPMETEDVYRLPPPKPLPYDAYGRQVCTRVPPPLPSTDQELDINYDEATAPSPSLIFQAHLDRWNIIHQRWREAAVHNEHRYDSSCAILRHMHTSVDKDPVQNYDMK